MFTKFYLISSLLIGISAASASDSGCTTSDSDSGDERPIKRSRLAVYEAQTAKSAFIDDIFSESTVGSKIKYSVNAESVTITEKNSAYTARHTFKRAEHKEGYGITGYFKRKNPK